MTVEAGTKATAEQGTGILTIEGAAKALRDGTITSVELTQGYLAKAETYFDILGGLLQGIPLAIKDHHQDRRRARPRPTPASPTPPPGISRVTRP